ncbi:DUF4386 domain-containing protein [Hyalangium minutum]|uniref:DUF4386 domain-containing protein n=1 Tax=Hyalangium minutum TaxID=394096 RepID=A0A085WWC6_9BACT|nr:DUF4386 domain-containing protein [Hyalangium minutum]KFE71989.1 hypothetical protein DB31_0250 [Hyalangium minutum]
MNTTRLHSRSLGILFLLPFFAVAYVCTRVMEALLLLVGVVFLLSILQLGESAQGQTTSERVLLFKLLSKGNFWAYQLAMIILGAGSVAFCLSLYQSRLLPSFLPLVGAVGYGLLALGSVFELFGLPWGILFSGPGGLFELFLGGWLIAKGFRTVTPSIAA